MNINKKNNTMAEMNINLTFLQSILSEFVHDFSSIATGITVGVELSNCELNKKEKDESFEILSKSAKKLKHCVEFYRSAYNLDPEHIKNSTKKYFSHLDVDVIWNQSCQSTEYNVILTFLLIWLSKKVKKNSTVTISNTIHLSNANIPESEIQVLTSKSPYYFFKYEKTLESPMLELALKYAKSLNYLVKLKNIEEHYVIEIKK